MQLSYLHLLAKQNLIIFKYDKVIDIVASPPSNFCTVKYVCIMYHSKIPLFRKKSWVPA